MEKLFTWRILSIGLLLCGLGPIWVQQAVAQRDGPSAEVVYEIDWNERLKPNLGMQAHDHSLLGDAIDLQTGRLSFEQVDVSIPGNSDLPVEVRRRRNPSQSYGNEFADWQLVAPTISTKIMSTEILNGARWGKRRCSKPLKKAIPDSLFAQKEFNEFPGILLPQQYSDGVLLDVPGRVSSQVLDKTVTGSWPADAQKVTAAGWYLTCIANIDGKGTEGFHAYAPNGDRYRFDVVRLRKGVSGQERWKIEPTRRGNYDVTGFGIEGTYYDVLAASQVVDVNNNWVRYDYDDQGRLTSIRANDGRRINFAYRSSTSIVVATATANPGSSDERRWTYSYGTESVYSYTTSSANGRATYEYSNVGGYAMRNLALTRVMLPDGRQWRFNLGGLFAGAVSGDSYRPRGSSEVVTCKQADQVVSVTHPDGMTGEFKLSERTVYMPISASGLGPPCPHASLGRRNSDAHTDMMSVVKKTLSGPGVPTATWKYSYETGGPERTTIIQPDGSKIYNIYPVISTAAPSAITSSALYANEFDATPLQLTEYTYLLEPEAGKGFFPSKPENSKPLRQKEITLTRGSDWYKTRYSYISDRNASNYSYGFPTKIEKWSSLGGGRRTTDITYVKDENDWILGLTNTVTRNGKLFDDYDYDPAGRLVTHKRFGVTIARLGYVTSGRASGRIAWHKDALGRKTTYSSNWDRGVPVKIEYADNSSFERKVDRNGWVIRETNARGYITNYEYDDAGRLTKIDLPDDLNDWRDTDIDYTYSDGMLLQTATDSSFKKTTTTYDAMLRPVRVEREDLRGERVAPGDYVETTYDAMGRVIFASLPTYVDEPNIYAPYGTITRYDALGRVKQSISSDRGRDTTRYEYLPGNKIRVTDPEGNVTTTTRSGFGGPGDGETVLVEKPEAIATQYRYDIYGNLTKVLQKQDSVFGVTQNYYYDERLRLCRHHSKERQSTLYRYNNANEMTVYADGQRGGTSCDMPSTGRILLTYDPLGRLEKTDFPNTPQDIVRTYDANGNLSSIKNGDVKWDYEYNSIDLIEKESLAIDGRKYEIEHYYYKNGAPSTKMLPSGRYIVPDIDGFGRTTSMSTGNCPTWLCIDKIEYFPNGMIKNLSFDDGKLYSQGQDNMQRLLFIRGNWGEDWYYGRDKNGRLTDIYALGSSVYNRTFGYDGAGRLVSATGPWGQARYEYDQLGNLKRKTLGSRVVDINYNGSNRVSRVRDSAVSSAWRNYSHDARGNVSRDGHFSFVHNHANRLVSLSGRNASGNNISASYTYDGNLKRVKQVVGGETIYSIYEKSGNLVMRDNVTKGEVTEYIQISGKTFLKFKNDVPYYIYSDHLGTPIMEARAGSPVEETAVYNYTPFGENIASPFNNAVNDPANHNGQGYTGHIEDSSGLVYMQARYYDPVIGRFLQTDPVGYEDQMNLYAYVHNDPMNATDPTGEFANFLIGAAIGIVAEVVVQTVIEGKSLSQLDGGKIAQSAAIGALSGGVGGAAGKLAGRAVTSLTKPANAFANGASKVATGAASGSVGGAVGAATHSTATQLVETGTVDGGKVAKTAALGAVTGGLGGAAAGQVSANAASKILGSSRASSAFTSAQPGEKAASATGTAIGAASGVGKAAASACSENPSNC